MAHTTTVLAPTEKRRRWNRRTYYVSDEMANAATRLAADEEARTGSQVGAGRMFDRAMRRYLADTFSPDEMVELVRPLTGPNGHASTDPQ